MKDMKKNVYNIVWADDDIDVLYDDLMERRFRENDFVLYGKAYTADELEKIIEADTNKIDAVIIDANFTESNKLVDSERNFSGLDYCRLIAKRFNQLPFFVFTGRTMELLMEHYKDSNSFFKEFPESRIYRKDVEGQLDNLFEAIKIEAAAKAQRIYSDIFDILDKKDYCFNKETRKVLLTLLNAVNTNEEPENPFNYYNQIRKTLEYIFRTINKFGIIPDEICFTNFSNKGKEQVAITDCYRYLLYDFFSDDEKKILIKKKLIKKKYQESVFTEIISKEIISIVKIGHRGSHSSMLSPEEYNVYYKKIASKYLLFSCVMVVCEALRQMDAYLRKNPNKDTNEKKVISI